MTAEALSKKVGIPRLKLLKILEEMQADNILEARTDTRRVTTWKMKGFSNSL
jgi:DNA-binding IscR family transcriptional regulator